MPVRLMLFKEESYFKEPVGEKGQFIEKIIQFNPDEHVLKSGKLDSFINDYLVSWLRRVDFGVSGTEDSIFTISVEHVDK